VIVAILHQRLDKVYEFQLLSYRMTFKKITFSLFINDPVLKETENKKGKGNSLALKSMTN
jgi:hypothetical protein